MKKRIAIPTKTPPVDDGANGKCKTTGRFMPGNSFGRGNPFAKRIAEYRGIMMEVVTRKRMRSIILGLVKAASRGDTCAAKVLLDRCGLHSDLFREHLKPDEEIDVDERFL